jgi:transcriptional regulator of acetoin/glycerol metabolism
MTLDEITRDAIVASLVQHKGNKVHAARALGITRGTIVTHLKRWNLVSRFETQKRRRK